MGSNELIISSVDKVGGDVDLANQILGLAQKVDLFLVWIGLEKRTIWTTDSNQ